MIDNRERLSPDANRPFGSMLAGDCSAAACLSEIADAGLSTPAEGLSVALAINCERAKAQPVYRNGDGAVQAFVVANLV